MTPEAENLTEEIASLKDVLAKLEKKVEHILSVPGYGQRYIESLEEMQKLIWSLKLTLKRIE